MQSTKQRVTVGFLGLLILWLAFQTVPLLFNPSQATGGYQILDKMNGPGQVTLWVRVRPDTAANEIQGYGDELNDRYRQSGKEFMVTFYDGPRTPDASHVIGSYEAGQFIDTR